MKKTAGVSASPQDSQYSVDIPVLADSAAYHTCLCKSSQEGDVKAIRKYLSSILPLQRAEVVNEKDRGGWAPLHYAARYGHDLVLEELLNHGGDADSQTDNNKLTSLHLAVKGLHAECVDTLMSRGANVALMDERGKSALHMAARVSVKLLQVILKYRSHVDVNQRDRDNMTPLMDAVNASNLQACQNLIDAGASIYLKDVGDQTALIIASGIANHEVVQLLLDQGEKNPQGQIMLTSQDNEGNSALHLACMNNQMKNARMLLEAGAYVNQTKQGKLTCLHVAPIYGFTEMVSLLIEYGGDVKARNVELATPLHNAALFNQVECMQLLLKQDCDKNARNVREMTPLHSASWKGHSEAVQCLIKAGCDEFAVDGRLRTVLHWITLGGHANCLAALKSLVSQAKFSRLLAARDDHEQTCLHLAAALGDTDMVGQLLENGADPAAKTEDNKTPIHLAAQHGNCASIERLFEASRLEINDGDANGRTPILLACLHGHYQSVNTLLRCGGDLMARGRDESNHSTLTLAASQGHIAIVDLLLDNNANIEAYTKHKNTAMHLACQNDHEKMVKLLLSHKADLTARNNEYKTPLDVAIENRSVSSATLIIQSDRWREAMNCLDVKKRTAFPALIAYMPSVARLVLDRCVERTGDPEDPEFQIRYDFSYIDIPPTDKGCNSARVWYVNDMIEHKCEELLKHELVNKNIDSKWESGAQGLHWLGCFYYFFILFFVNGYALLSPVIESTVLDRYGCPLNLTEDQINNETVLNYWFMTGQNYSQKFEGHNIKLMESFSYILMGIFTIYCIQLVASLVIYRLWFFRKWSTYSTAALMLCTIVWVSPTSGEQDYSLPCTMQWRFGWMAIILAWLNALSYIVRIPGRGLYVLMFSRVLASVVKVLLFLIVFFLAFGSCFYITMGRDAAFFDIGLSILTTFEMGFGEIHYMDRVIQRTSSPFYYDNLVLMTLFLVIIPISLMNLLVGLAVGDIEAIRSQAELKLMEMRVAAIFEAEANMIKSLQRRLYKSHVIIRPNDESSNCCTMITRWFRRHVTRSTYHRKRGWRHIISEPADTMTLMHGHIQLQNQRLADLEEKFARQSALMEAVASKMGAHLDLRGKPVQRKRPLVKSLSTVSDL